MYSLTRLPHRGVSLPDAFDSLFAGLVPSVRGSDLSAGFAPALDIFETADGHEIRVDLPGVKKEDLSVNVKENVLTIEAQSRDESERKDGALLANERRTGRYYRALRLGKAVDESRISADYTDGVLTLTLPRSAQVEGRKIAVKVH